MYTEIAKLMFTPRFTPNFHSNSKLMYNTHELVIKEKVQLTGSCKSVGSGFSGLFDVVLPAPSRSSITKSIGILPFKQLIYRWQKLSHNSWTWKENRKQLVRPLHCDTSGNKNALNQTTIHRQVLLSYMRKIYIKHDKSIFFFLQMTYHVIRNVFISYFVVCISWC